MQNPGQGSRAPTPNERKDPRDANPMFKRLPAEVVSRRKRPDPSAVPDGEEAVSLDRKAVFVLKPEHRLKWLTKALKQAADGKVMPSEIYDVVASTRFAENLPPKVGRKMGRALKEQVGIFTAKQQKFLNEQADIITRFAMDYAPSTKGDEDKGSAMDEMMARVAAFVTEKESERAKGDDAGSTASATAPVVATAAATEQDKPASEPNSNKQSTSAKETKQKKEKDAKADKAKAEKKSSKEARTKSKNGTKRDSSGSDSSSRSRSKSRTKKKRKAKKSSKKDSKRRARSSGSGSSSSSRSRSSSSASDRKAKEKKKKRRARSSSESSSRNRKRKRGKS